VLVTAQELSFFISLLKAHDISIFAVTSCFGFPNEFAAIAMNYFDRVLSRSNPLPCSKSEIQLLALTCFYLSVKLFQAGPILSTEQICMISGYVYVPAEIVAMEQNILRKLEWCLYPPLPSEFLRPYLKILLCHANSPLPLYYDEILNLALEMMNALVFDYYFVAGQFPSSHVAVAAIVNAMLTVLPLSPEQPTIHEATRILSQLTGYKLDESAVFLCCKRLWGLMNKNCHQNWDLTMTPSYSSSCIRRDHRTGSPTPSSPIGVVASITILNDNEKAIYRPIEQSSAQSYNFFLS
jgi:Cyclin, N-terminal domain/Cyclin, C-terminal domain